MPASALDLQALGAERLHRASYGSRGTPQSAIDSPYHIRETPAQ
jgi:hypothetical protein